MSYSVQNKAGKIILVVGLSPDHVLPLAKALVGPHDDNLVIAASPGITASELPDKKTTGVIFLHLDPSQATSPQLLCHAIQKKYGRLDSVIQWSDFPVAKNLIPMSAEQWQEAIQKSLSARFYCAQAAFGTMRECGGGVLLQLMPSETQGVGRVLEASVNQMVDLLVEQGRAHGITAKAWPIDLNSPAGLRHAGDVALSFLESSLVHPTVAANHR